MVLILLINGCATGSFDRINLRSQLRSQLGISGEKALDQSPGGEPLKLAVHFQRPLSRGKLNKQWSWEPKDRAQVLRALYQLKSQKKIDQIIPLHDLIIEEYGVEKLQKLAKAQGADSLLLITANSAEHRYFNQWGLTYLLVLPAFFVKGSEVDHLFLVNASFWKIGQTRPFLSLDAEALEHRQYAFLAKEEKPTAIEKVKIDALTTLGQRIELKFKEEKNDRKRVSPSRL